MTQVLPKSAQNFQESLQSKGLDCKVIQLSDSTHTAQAAADALQCTISQIVKSLIFKTKNGHQPILMLTSGSNRVNEKTLAAQVGEPIMKADASFTRDVTGFAIGGIPPMGHKHPIPLIFIDEDLLQFESVWAAAGTPKTVFNISCQALKDLTGGQVISVK